MTAHSSDILWLKNTSKEDAFSTGSKAATLGELLQERFPIPDGFVVTSFAYFHFLNENKLIHKINQLLTTINYTHPDSVLQVAHHIQKLIETTKLSETFLANITKAYHQLNGSFVNAPVFLHVSPTGTTSSTLSQTYANVHGETNLMLKIKHAWASLFEPEVIMNRHHKHIDHFQDGIALIVQKTVIGEHMGTMMTVDPVTHDKSHLIIEVIDDVTDHYVIDKTRTTHEIIQKNIAGAQQKISDKEIGELATLGKNLEKHLYFPQEISFVIAKGTIFILQTKPLTTHPSSTNVSPIASKLPIILKGIPVSHGIVTGRIRCIEQTKDLEKIMHGDILVAKDLPTNHKQFLKKASGIITDQGGRTSHIAIFAREWGIPAIVGTKHATTNFRTGQILTIDGAAGHVYQGPHTSSTDHTSLRQTTTHLYTTISEFSNVELLDVDSDGVLLLPKKQVNFFTDTINNVCKDAGNHPVLYRIPDPLPQGEHPMMGFRGTYRLLHTTDEFKQELHTIKQLRSNTDCKNFALVLPFIRSLHELSAIKHLMAESGISRDATFNLWIELAVPGNTILLDEFIQAGIDGIVIDIDTLSMLLLGIDRTNSEIAYGYDALDPAILQTLEKIVKTAHRHQIKTVVYGETLVHHSSLIEKLISWGVTGIAVETDHLTQTKHHIQEIEKRIVENRHTS